MLTQNPLPLSFPCALTAPVIMAFSDLLRQWLHTPFVVSLAALGLVYVLWQWMDLPARLFSGLYIIDPPSDIVSFAYCTAHV